MKREIWAIGNITKINNKCFKCKEMLFGCLMVENVGCIPCNIKKCKYTKKELKRYGKLDDGTVVHLRILK